MAKRICSRAKADACELAAIHLRTSATSNLTPLGQGMNWLAERLEKEAFSWHLRANEKHEPVTISPDGE